MKNDKEKYIIEVFDSLKGSERAKPNAALFTKIENQIFGQEAKIISLPQWKMAVAVAIVILIVNIVAIQNFTQNNTVSAEEIMTGESNEALISNYKLYDL